jgi:tetratricopeptide (TPR) repeat protein
MSYPGNPSLSADVQQRILSTFEQTLDLAAEGSRQEALLGCDFVLRMDPQFESARRLQERLRSASGAIPVDDLRLTAAAAPAPTPEDLFTDLDGLGFDLPDLPQDEPLGAPGNGSGSLHAELQALLDERRFEDLLGRAQRDTAVAADPELRRIAATAQERMEAEPYVLKFLGSARRALQAGDAQEVERLLAKARSLDPSHPGIAELERAQAPAVAPPPEPQIAAGPSGFPPPSPDLAQPFDAFGGDSESARRIDVLLREGQRAYEAGDPQAAIDSWSRIFLIDIDHQEAARRIELARKLKAEKERQVEEIFHDGLSGIESGNLGAARQAFSRVLELQPTHLTAREYLDQIDSGTVPVVRPAAASREATVVTAEPALPLTSDLASAPVAELKEEILVPPEPGEMPARAPARREAKPIAAGEGRRAGRLFLLVGAAVLLLVAAGGWFVWQNREELFPNSRAEEAAAPPQAAPSPIARATKLHQSGKTAIAVSQLRRIPPGDPYYQEAQALLQRWGAPAGTQRKAGPSPEALAKRQELLDAARRSYGERSYLRAVEQFQNAAALGALDPADAEQLAYARTQVRSIERYVQFFKDEEWEYILPQLWRLHEENPADRDVTRLIIDSYYNLGVDGLRGMDPARAEKMFQDALSLAPEDPEIRRHLLFAQTYQSREQDLLYRVYTKHLQFR